MSFGRRPSITPDSLKSLQAASDCADGGSGEQGRSLSRPVKGMLAGFAAVGILLASHVAMMSGFGRLLDQHWSNGGFPETGDAFKRTAAPDKLLEQVHNNCLSQSDFVGRNAPKSSADLMSGDGIAVGRAVTYLTCLAGEQPKRFCDKSHRLHLFATLKDYYRLKEKIREDRWMQNGGPFAASRPFGGPERETFATTAAAAQETDPRVIGLLKRLVAGGYVSRADLFAAVRGWPNDLDLALRDVEPKQKGCA